MLTITSITINFLLGVITSFSPCLFPLLPSYVAATVNSKRSRNASQKVLLLSALSLMGGVLLVFFSLTLLINATIAAFLLQNYVTFAKIQALLLSIAGILLITKPSFLSKIQLPNRFHDMIYGNDENSNPYKFSFLIGLFYTIIAAPCAGGYFLAVWALMIGFNILEQFLLVVAFSFGAGVPFLLVSGLIPKMNVTRFKNIQFTTDRISLVLGVILILTGIYLFSIVAF